VPLASGWPLVAVLGFIRAPPPPPPPPFCPRFAYHPGPVMAQYQVEVARRVDQFDGQSLTTTMWAMAALSVRGRPLPPGRPRGLHRHACAAGCQPGLPGP
jgi:hypothetical protein